MSILTAVHQQTDLANTLNLGPISVPLYGLLIMLGVVAAFSLGVIEAKKIGINPNDGVDGLLIILPLALLGTRLWYVVFEWDQFKDYLPSIIGFQRDGTFSGLQGLAIHGGFITAFVATVIFTRRRNINPYSALDLVAPGFLIAQSMGRWGNFFNKEANGRVIGGFLEDGTVALDWDAQRQFLSGTLRLPEFIVNNMFFVPKTGGSGLQYYHPAFLYESVWNIAGFAIMLILRRTKLTRAGDLIGFYLIWYSIGRFMIESLRTDPLYLWNTGIRTAQVTSVLMILGGVALLVFNHVFAKRKHYHEYLQENKVEYKTEVEN